MNIYQQLLQEKYQQLADHTKSECGSCPRIKPHGCCRAEHCKDVQAYALSEWQVKLADTGHPTLPLMSLNNGRCTAAPYLRPQCTAHTCEIYSWGIKRNDPEWTEKYYDLRSEIFDLEVEKGVAEAIERNNLDFELNKASKERT